jgi:hypothetical protein
MKDGRAVRIRERNFVQRATRIANTGAERCNRARVALETVDGATRERIEELEGVRTVVAADLENQRIRLRNEPGDFPLRERDRMGRNFGWSPTCLFQ